MIFDLFMEVILMVCQNTKKVELVLLTRLPRFGGGSSLQQYATNSSVTKIDFIRSECILF